MQAEWPTTPDTATFGAVPRTAPAGQVELKVIARILHRRRREIAMAGAGAFLAALAYCLIAPSQYTATAQILIDPRDKLVVANDVNPSAIAADGGVTQVESQGNVLLSDEVLKRATETLHLDADSDFNGSGLLHALSDMLPWSRLGPKEAHDRALAHTLQTLRKQARYTRADKALVLELRVTAATAQKAADIANAIANGYLEDQKQARAKSHRDASSELESRLNELRADVERKETAVEDYRTAHNFVVSTGQLVSDQEINQTTAQLTAAQNRVATLKAQLDQLRQNAGTQGTPEAMSSVVMGRLRDREGALVEKLAAASRLLGPRHPDIASLQQSLADVRALIAREAQRLRQAAEADYMRAVEDETTLAAKLDEMKAKSLDDGKADVTLRELQRQAEAARTIYSSFLVRAKETMEASNVDTTNARIITPALPPLQKSWPPTLLLLLGASVLGLSFGAGGALAHEYLRPHVYTPAQLNEALDAPTLGVVRQRDLKVQGANRPARVALEALMSAEAGVGMGRCAFVVSTPAAAPSRRLFAERLAALAALEGHETLLIDADLAHEATSERPGLRDWVRGDQSIADLTYRQEGEDFARLDKGGADPTELVRRDGVETFRLRRARRRYEVLVVDAGAMSENARIAPLAAKADLTVFVAETGASVADLAREVDAAFTASARFDAAALVELDAA